METLKLIIFGMLMINILVAIYNFLLTMILKIFNISKVVLVEISLIVILIKLIHILKTKRKEKINHSIINVIIYHQVQLINPKMVNQKIISQEKLCLEVN